MTAKPAPNPDVTRASGAKPRREMPAKYHRAVVNGAMVLGAVLVAASGTIHLHLWMGGYRNIHIIGPMFLAQAISAFAIAIAIAVLRWATLALVGAALLAGTIGGLLATVWHGVFGFQDSLGAPYAGLSLFMEGAGIVVLVSAAFGRYQLRRGRWQTT